MNIRQRILFVVVTWVLAPMVFAETGNVENIHSRIVYSKLEDIAIHPTRSAPATALSLNHATLSAQILARVESIAVGVSQTVSKGDNLLQLDCTDYQLALETARVAFKIAEARLQLADSQKVRSDQLLTRQLTSQESADTALVDAIARRGEWEQARLALKKAEIEVARCQVVAPYDGIITQRDVSVGQLASVGTALISLVETDHIELSAQVKPMYLQHIKNASEILFEAGQNYPVSLLRLGGVVNTQTRNQEIRLSFADQMPPPGTAGKLVWQDARNYVPTKYLVSRNGELGVFLYRDGKASFYSISGAIPGRPALLTLPADELIITSQLGQLSDGQSVQP